MTVLREHLQVAIACLGVALLWARMADATVFLRKGLDGAVAFLLLAGAVDHERMAMSIAVRTYGFYVVDYFVFFNWFALSQ